MIQKTVAYDSNFVSLLLLTRYTRPSIFINQFIFWLLFIYMLAFLNNGIRCRYGRTVSFHSIKCRFLFYTRSVLFEHFILTQSQFSVGTW